MSQFDILKNDLKFQIIEWYAADVVPKTGSESDDSEESEQIKKYKEDLSEYKIIIFGKDENDITYSLMVNEFTPYFYIKVPSYFKKSDLNRFERWVRGAMWSKYRKSFLRTKLLKKKVFRNFNNFKQFYFVRLVFRSRAAMSNAIRLFQNKIWNSTTRRIDKILPKKIKIAGIDKKEASYELFENTIDPLLRFIHHRSLKPVGWTQVKFGKYNKRDEMPTHCNYDLETRWSNIKSMESDKNAKIKVMAYDIECDSAHGDFPLPTKDYLKLAREIVSEYERIQKYVFNNDENNSKSQVFKNYIQNKQDMLEKMMKQALKNDDEYINYIDISQVYTKNGSKPTDKTINLISHKLVSYLTNYDPKMKTTDRNKLKNKSIEDVNKLITEYFPEVEGDQTIQIGCSFFKYGESSPYRNVMYTLGTCDPIKDTEVKVFKSEKNLLLAFTKLINSEDPEIITGYNILGFDTPWIFKRATELGIEERFSKMSRLKDHQCKIKVRQQKSSVGQLVKIEFVDIPGRTQLDIFKLVQSSYNLNSYKLDNVSSGFIQGSVKKLEYDKKMDQTIIITDNVRGLNSGNFIIFIEKNGYLEDKYLEGKKYEIQNIQPGKITVNSKIDLKLETCKCTWNLGKDDVSPKDIFRLQKGNSYDRYIIAKYCMMDVILCVELLIKLEFITKNIGMANVCLIPFDWAIHRGQGVKILSLVSDILRKEDYLLPYLYKSMFSNESYEGAIVLPPHPGIYLDEPVAVLDYASLYPSSMIMGNLSHETICIDDEWLGDDGAKHIKSLGLSHYDVTYDTFEIIRTPAGSVKEKRKIGEKTVRYVQYPNDKKGIMPTTLQKLLKARKDTRKRIKYKKLTLHSGEEYVGLLSDKGDKYIVKTEKNGDVTLEKSSVDKIVDRYSDFEKSVLDGQQQGFKITANSLYGQIGAKTSDLYYREIAASTTAVGRDQLGIAQKYCEDTTKFKKTLNDGTIIQLKNKIVYGDTDSVFVKFDCVNPDGSKMIGKDALAETIRLAQIAEKGINKQLMKPQDIEYEKTFWPFILFTKKKYVGNKYEFDVNKYKQTAMGIVLKRRDNAPIVKVVFGGIIDSIMKEKRIEPSINFLQKNLQHLVKGKYGLDALIISKTLSSFYKDPDRIAHKVLADRIGERDPGNKPQINDRIPFVYIETKSNGKEKILQGDKIEHPNFIKQHKLKPDYEFYITNQIMRPVCQIYALVVEKIPGYNGRSGEFEQMIEKYKRDGKSHLDALKTVLGKKQKTAENILFGDTLRTLSNSRKGNSEITNWFTKKVIENGSVAKSYGGRKLNLDDSWSDESESDDDN
jgi:DNA polymerase elongation subunit (family B)